MLRRPAVCHPKLTLSRIRRDKEIRIRRRGAVRPWCERAARPFFFFQKHPLNRDLVTVPSKQRRFRSFLQPPTPRFLCDLAQPSPKNPFLPPTWLSSTLPQLPTPHRREPPLPSLVSFGSVVLTRLWRLQACAFSHRLSRYVVVVGGVVASRVGRYGAGTRGADRLADLAFSPPRTHSLL